MLYLVPSSIGFSQRWTSLTNKNKTIGHEWRSSLKARQTHSSIYGPRYAVSKGITRRNQFFMPISKTSHRYIVLSYFVSEQKPFLQNQQSPSEFLDYLLTIITHCSFHFQFYYEISSRCKVIKKHMTIIGNSQTQSQ